MGFAADTPKANGNRAPAGHPPPIDPAATPGGVIGLGLMGQSIVTCLLSAGHKVTAITRRPERESELRRRIRGLLGEMRRKGLRNGRPPVSRQNLIITSDYAALGGCAFVIESIIEERATKQDVLRRIEEAVPPVCLIGTNTSAIPVTTVQAGMAHPERLLGVHWAEPAHVQRFLEIICGARSAPQFAGLALQLADLWGKEPTLVRRDVRGFIANRLMYAMIREAFHLVEAGYASIEDVDRSARNDMGWWLTLAGPFRWMDLTGIPAYAAVMRDLFPELSNAGEVPALMKEMVESGARGIANSRGFYRYTPEQARSWEKKFLDFTYDIRKLALKYAPNNGEH